MQRPSTLDTSFLRVVTASAHEHVGGLASLRLDRHIAVETEPVGGRRDLERRAGRLLSQQLDRGKPLRQIVVPRAGP